MKLFTFFSLFMSTFSLLAEEINKWQEVEHRATLATRFSHHKKAIETGDYLNESTLIVDHQYQSFILAWRVNQQLYQDPIKKDLQSDNHVELNEASYSFSLLDNENDFWQLGKFNHPLDPGYALRSVDFFEPATNPFDDFSSIEGIKMGSLSLWLEDYYLSLLIALEGTQALTEDLNQWAIVVQRDFEALSSSLILQQYEHSNIGFGSTFTYVLADNWAFHGSGLIRQGSLWREQFNGTPIQFNKNEHETWYPKVVFGALWTTMHLQLLMEYNYQKEKITHKEEEALKQLQPQSYEAASLYQSSLHQLYTQSYQQHYLFAQAQYTIEDHIFTANTLIGEDVSALSQLKYEYLATFNLSGWLAMELASGKDNSEFRRIPWQNRVQVGLQWKI